MPRVADAGLLAGVGLRCLGALRGADAGLLAGVGLRCHGSGWAGARIAAGSAKHPRRGWAIPKKFF